MSFSQRKLWEALQNPQSIDATDEMEVMIEKYPYFQLLRTLVAKAKHDQRAPDAYDWLGKAAIYAPDRRRLRQVFYDELTVTLPDSDQQEGLPEEKGRSGNAVIIETPDTVEEEAQDAYVTEHKNGSSENADDVYASEVNDSANTEADHNIHEDEALREELEKTLHTLRQSKEQLPDSTNPDEWNQSTAEATSTDGASSLADDNSPSEDKPSTPQQAIIERFMRANPSISRDMDSEDTKPATDLAAGSTKFQDDLVTENLAGIMLKQGKEAKAIALYEKLMLKYPEKKTYFAQKIDQLKNN